MPYEMKDLDFDFDTTKKQAKLTTYQARLKEIRQLSASATDEEIDILKQMCDLYYFVNEDLYDELWITVNRKASVKQIITLMQGMEWSDGKFWPTLVQCCDANELSDVVIAHNVIVAAAKVYLLTPAVPEQKLLSFYEEILQKSPYAKSGQQMFVNTPDALTLIFESLYSRLRADMENSANLQDISAPGLQDIRTLDIVNFVKNKIRGYLGQIERGELPRLKSAGRQLIDLVHRIESMNLASAQAQDKEFLGALYVEPNRNHTIPIDHQRGM